MWTDAVEILRSAPPGQRLILATFIDSLGENPFILGDYSERDETDREVQIKIVGKFAVTYWADHAVAEVKVVDLQRADGR